MAAAVFGTLGQSRSFCASAGPGPARAMEVLHAVESGTRPCGLAHLVAKDVEEGRGAGVRGVAALGAFARKTVSSRSLLFRGVETLASWTGRDTRPSGGPASTAIGGACMSAAAAGESTLGSAAGVSRGVSSTMVVGPASGVGAAAAAVAGAAAATGAADLAVVVVAAAAGAGSLFAVHVAGCEVGTCVIVDGAGVAGAVGA